MPTIGRYLLMLAKMQLFLGQNTQYWGLTVPTGMGNKVDIRKDRMVHKWVANP